MTNEPKDSFSEHIADPESNALIERVADPESNAQIERHADPESTAQIERVANPESRTRHACHANTERVLVAMSGGVDSTVAAILLANNGFDITGMTGKMFGSNVCGSDEHCLDQFLDQVDAAKAACRKLGIEHYTFNLKTPFEQHVIDAFVDGYLHGETPNPCIDCNKHVKFGELQKRRRDAGYDKLATGHYARIRYDENTRRWKLLRALDPDKDQTYMLYGLTQDQLAHTLFPLGELSKSDVRMIAARAGMKNAEAEESQDICFVQDGDYLGFVKRWVEKDAGASESSKATTCEGKPTTCEGNPAKRENAPATCKDKSTLMRGDIRDMQGKIVGQHDGIAGYTIGQRKGIGIAANEPLYVIDKDASTNTLIVGAHEELLTTQVHARDVNFVSISKEQAHEMLHENGHLEVLAKTSYRQEPQPAHATFTKDGMTVEFDEPLVRPAPGQAIVLYNNAVDQELLAGATIV